MKKINLFKKEESSPKALVETNDESESYVSVSSNESLVQILHNLNESCKDFGSLQESINKDLNEFKDIFNIGKISIDFILPINVLSKDTFETSMDLYEAKEGFEDTTPVTSKFEIYNDNGFMTFNVYPIKGYSFDEEDLENVGYVNDILYTFCARLRYVELVDSVSEIDTLTGVPNLKYVEKFFNELVENGVEQEYTCLYFNIKGLKYFNITYGIRTVNAIVRDYIRILSSYVDEEEEVLGRVGGDNFIGLVKDEHINDILKKLSGFNYKIPDSKPEEVATISSRVGVYDIAKKDSMADVLEGVSIAIGVSRNIGSDVVHFNTNMAKNIYYERMVFNMFDKALKNDEFIVNFQPKIDSRTNQIIAAEVILSWPANDTIIPAYRFIPILEARDVICELDFYVLEKVCKTIKSLEHQGLNPVKITVKFAKNHFKKTGTARKIFEIIRKYDVNPAYVGIEFDEILLEDDIDTFKDIVDSLKRGGVPITVDNFGKGYSSILLVKDLEPTSVKLDKEFLQGLINGEDKDKIFLRDIIQVIKDRGVIVVAKGIYSEEQVEFLNSINCYIMQGSFFDEEINFDVLSMKLNDYKYEY